MWTCSPGVVDAADAGPAGSGTGERNGRDRPLEGQCPNVFFTRLRSRRGSKSPTATRMVFSRCEMTAVVVHGRRPGSAG